MTHLKYICYGMGFTIGYIIGYIKVYRPPKIKEKKRTLTFFFAFYKDAKESQILVEKQSDFFMMGNLNIPLS